MWTAERQFSRIQVIRITIRPFTLENRNIFYFERSGQIATHSAIKTQMQMQTEFEAFKTQDDSISGLFNFDLYNFVSPSRTKVKCASFRQKNYAVNHILVTLHVTMYP